MELANILDDCLQQLRSDRSVADCLARHPDQAAELAPMLQAALSVQSLAEKRLSDGQRLRAKVAMREALAARRARPPRRGWFSGAPALRGLAAVGAVFLLLLVIATTAIAASGPGDPAYALRVRLERAPALIQTTAAARVRAELAVTDRRIADLEAYLAASGEVDEAAVNALMAGQSAVAANAEELPEGDRVQIAARLENHFQVLTRLAAQGPEQRAAARLQVAAQQALAIAERLRARPQAPGDPASPEKEQPPAGVREPTPARRTPGTATPTRPETREPSRPDRLQPPERTAPVPGEQPDMPSATPRATPGQFQPAGGNPPATPTADPATAPDPAPTRISPTVAPEATPAVPGPATPHEPTRSRTPESGATPPAPGNSPAPGTPHNRS